MNTTRTGDRSPRSLTYRKASSHPRGWRTGVFLAFALLVMGCAGAPAQPAPRALPAATAALPTATAALPTATVALPTATVALPTATAALPTDPVALTPTAMATATPWSSVATVEGDYYVLGNPAAPILLLDYSNFL